MEKIQRLCENMESVILGKPGGVRLVIIGLLSGGHVLIEDVPGVGKSTLARALARSIQGTFRRIQFTPDSSLRILQALQSTTGMRRSSSSNQDPSLHTFSLRTRSTAPLPAPRAPFSRP